METLTEPLGTTGAIEYFKKDIRNQTQENENSMSDESVGKDEKLPALLQAIQKKKNEDGAGGSEDIIMGESITFWSGQLSKEFGLTGKVTEKEFNQLCRGQHPHTKEQLVRHVYNEPQKLDR